MAHDVVFKYFPNLTSEQIQQIQLLGPIYEDWNRQINVISRKDSENFFERHVLHSLAIAKIISFRDGSSILDVGTGGGFPGIPLAILFPECKFTLVDSIGKKIKVVNDAARQIGLKNLIGVHQRAEEVEGQFDFIVCRAVASMPKFLGWTRGKISKSQKNEMKNGILYLKGGDLTEELSPIKNRIEIFELKDYFAEDFFETKKLVYLED